jgi:hypothetical protein
MAREVRVQDLPDLLVSNEPIFLLCDECFAQHSAHAGDYWDWPKDHVFMCCEKPIRLVRKEVRFVDVKIPKKNRRK